MRTSKSDSVRNRKAERQARQVKAVMVELSISTVAKLDRVRTYLASIDGSCSRRRAVEMACREGAERILSRKSSPGNE